MTQNFFYISAPPAAAAPPTPGPAVTTGPPPEVHIHNDVHHYPRVRVRQTISFFGAVGLVLGALACGAAYRGDANLIRPLAIAGAAASAWGLFGTLLGRTGRGLPMLGVVLSASAYAFSIYGAAGLQKEIANVKTQLPKIDLGIDAVSSAPAPETTHQPSKPPAPSPSKPVPAPVIPPAPQPASPAPLPPPPAPVATAEQLESARVAAAARLGLDYSAVKQRSDQMAAELKQARQMYSPGSAELIAADRRWLEASTALKDMRGQLHHDPAVAAAERSISNPVPASSK